MSLRLLSDAELSPEARVVFEDIRATRKTDYVNNFWRSLAHDPVSLKRTWDSVKAVMAPGALDARTKELIYIAVSVVGACPLLRRLPHGFGARKGNDRRGVP